MKWNKKKIALLGIGLCFLFAMVILPLGDVAARTVWLELDAGPRTGYLEIDDVAPEINIDDLLFPRRGTPMIDIGYYLEIDGVAPEINIDAFLLPRAGTPMIDFGHYIDIT